MTQRRRVHLVCSCGTPFEVQPYRAKTAKYCSMECLWAFREIGANSGSFKPGERRSPETEFQSGRAAHNRLLDPSADYAALHDWVRRVLGHPTSHGCCHCGTKDSERRLQWANVSFDYRAHPDDWMVLCYRCHRTYDRLHGWGLAGQLFDRTNHGSYGRRRT